MVRPRLRSAHQRHAASSKRRPPTVADCHSPPLTRLYRIATETLDAYFCVVSSSRLSGDGNFSGAANSDDFISPSIATAGSPCPRPIPGISDNNNNAIRYFKGIRSYAAFLDKTAER